MSELNTKDSFQEFEALEHEKRKAKTAEVNPVAVDLAAAAAENPPKMLSREMGRIYFVMTVGYLVSTIQGYDGSLMGAINAMKPYQQDFDLSGAGASTGIVFIIYNVAQIAAFPFCGWLSDAYGRRACIFLGCLIVLIGTAIQGSAHHLGQFLAGRFILGFGAVVAHAAAPTYTVEMAHPLYRGRTAGMYNNFWWIGNILAGWTTYGTNLHLKSSWSWRIPTIMQAALPSMAMITVLFVPESPRWLIANDRADEALAILAKYHGNGNQNAAIVQLQYHEILEEHAVNPDVSPWWDYRDLVATRSARYRIMLVIACAFFGQWSGNNVVSYFMPAMVKSAGITNTNTQLLINAINPIISWMAAMVGASILDKFGRRQMMMGGLTGALFFYILLTAFTAQSVNVPNLSYGVIVSIYMFGVFFAGGMTPSATLYPMEVLENRTRAKGAAIKFVFLNIATLTNTFGISVGIGSIGWKLYLVYIVWIVFEIAFIYWFYVETAGKTLEELSVIFEAKNPRKESLKKIKVDIATESQIYDHSEKPSTLARE